MKDRFIRILSSVKRDGINSLINYLENETDFFNAPASTKYHLACEQGLLEHSLNVFDELLNEYNISELEANDEIKISALLHDICKSNFYEIGYRNAKNDFGKWESVPYYLINDKFSIGHGEKSVILIQKYIKLTDREITAIRWHMGSFESKDNYSYLNNSFNKCDLAVKLHIADLKATYLIENKGKS